MHLTCHCLACDRLVHVDVASAASAWTCPQCGHPRTYTPWPADAPGPCCNCGNSDLWRQKDFPQRLGLLMVAAGAVSSSIAWGFHRPVLALSILGAFAAVDMLLYWIMPDVLVCYRCRARHRTAATNDAVGPYNHELGERYRQERLQLEQAAAKRAV